MRRWLIPLALVAVMSVVGVLVSLEGSPGQGTVEASHLPTPCNLDLGLEISKQAEGPDSRTVVSGSQVTFTITVENPCDLNMDRIVVTDPLTPECDRDIPPLQGNLNGPIPVSGPLVRSYTYQCTTTQGVSTSFTNVATVTGALVGSNQPDDTATDSDPSSVEVVNAAIDIEKYTRVDAAQNAGDICDTFDKPQKLTMEYNPAGITQNSQDSGKVVITGSNPDPVAFPQVIIRVTDKDNPFDGKAKVYIAGQLVSVGDSFAIDSTVIPKDNLEANTVVAIYDPADAGNLTKDNWLQLIKFHTSCSQPLEFGDQFGSVELVGYTDKLGAVATPPAPPAGIGEDADVPTGPTAMVGDTIVWTYVVTNAGGTALKNVVVSDDQGVTVTCPQDTLSVGESMQCTASGIAVAGQYGNLGTVTGESDDASSTPVSDSDPSHYYGEAPQLVCTSHIQAMLLKYTGPDIAGPTTVEFDPDKGPTVTYSLPSLMNGDVLSDPAQNNFTIDATAGGETELGAKTAIRINGVAEVIHTSCSTPFVSGAPAPLDNPKGDPSPNWYVETFTQKP